MSPQLPTLLAIAGIVLLAIAIFAPRRLPTRVAHGSAPSSTEPAPGPTASEPQRDAPPQWPQLVEPSASECDAATRLDLVDALIALDSQWSREILVQALGDETDAAVRARITSGLGSSRGPWVELIRTD